MVPPREKSAWVHYLANDSRCAISVDEAEGLRKVVARCTAHMVEEPNIGGLWVPIAERMSTHYLGENGPKYLEPTLDKPRWLFRLDPVKVQTWHIVAWVTGDLLPKNRFIKLFHRSRSDSSRPA